MDAIPVPVQAGVHARYNLAYIWLICVAAAMGGLLFGYDWVVIGGAKPFFERYFDLTSAAPEGLGQQLRPDRLPGRGADGRGAERPVRPQAAADLLGALLFAVTSLGNALAPSFAVFVAWRMLGGVAIGLASNLSPMYIAEIAPAAACGAGWWRSTSSPSSSASCWRSSSTG